MIVIKFSTNKITLITHRVWQKEFECVGITRKTSVYVKSKYEYSKIFWFLKINLILNESKMKHTNSLSIRHATNLVPIAYCIHIPSQFASSNGHVSKIWVHRPLTRLHFKSKLTQIKKYKTLRSVSSLLCTKNNN